MAQQLGDPFRVLYVGLAPGHGFDVAGIDDQQGQRQALEQVVDRFPKYPRALHGHMRDA
jgi:hypothetical protein